MHKKGYIIEHWDSFKLDTISNENDISVYYNRQDIDFKIINKIAKRILKRENYNLLILHYFYGVRQRNLAIRLGVTQGAISQRLKRAKNKIKNIIIKHNIYEI